MDQKNECNEMSVRRKPRPERCGCQAKMGPLSVIVAGRVICIDAYWPAIHPMPHEAACGTAKFIRSMDVLERLRQAAKIKEDLE